MSQPKLHMPAQEALRRLCERYLRKAAKHCLRLQDQQDEQALHDFRVALRSLRSVIQSNRDVFDPLSKAQRRHLKRLGHNSNAARDLQVQLHWLSRQMRTPTAAQRHGVNWLQHHVHMRYQTEAERLQRELPVQFFELEKKLHKSFQTYQSDDNIPMQTVLRWHLQQIRERFDETLHALSEDVHDPLVHELRLLIKKYRYLIAPFRKESAALAEQVRQLKQLQEDFGEYNDACVFIEALPEYMRNAMQEEGAQLMRWALHGNETALARGRNVHLRHGLLAVAAQQHQRQLHLHARIRQRLQEGAHEQALRLRD